MNINELIRQEQTVRFCRPLISPAVGKRICEERVARLRRAGRPPKAICELRRCGRHHHARCNDAIDRRQPLDDQYTVGPNDDFSSGRRRKETAISDAIAPRLAHMRR
jgi:hypothetical protein